MCCMCCRSCAHMFHVMLCLTAQRSSAGMAMFVVQLSHDPQPSESRHQAGAALGWEPGISGPMLAAPTSAHTPLHLQCNVVAQTVGVPPVTQAAGASVMV